MNLQKISDSELQAITLWAARSTSGSLIARTLLATFYGIDIKTHNDPYVGLMEGPIAESARTLMGAPGLVVCLPSFCLYFHLSLAVPALLSVVSCHSIY